MSLKDWVERANTEAAERTARNPKPTKPFVTVRVLKPGVFSGVDHKSLGWKVPGDVFETAPNYAADIIQAGLVEQIDPVLSEQVSGITKPSDVLDPDAEFVTAETFRGLAKESKASNLPPEVLKRIAEAGIVKSGKAAKAKAKAKAESGG
jgi:hypothetical protein